MTSPGPSPGPVWALPILHPARILRGGWALEPAQRETLFRVRETLADLAAGQPPRHWLDTSVPPPGAILAPTLADLHRWCAADLAQGIAIDIECAGDVLVGIGFTRVVDLVSLWVPFRRQGGGLYWSREDLPYAAWWCQLILASPWPKLWHNGLCFDIPYLIRTQGFVVEGPHTDTILLAHIHMPEMPKSLQYQATYHLGIPSWKQLSDVDEEMDK